MNVDSHRPLRCKTHRPQSTVAECIMTIAIRLLVEEEENHPPPKNKNPLNKQIEKHGNDYIDIIIVTDHDPKIIPALGNALDLGPRNFCNYIINRCKDIARVFQASVVSS